MQKLFSLLYTLWAAFWFIAILVILFPLFWIFLQKDEWKPYAHYLVRFWATLLFFIIGVPIKVQYDFMPDPKKAYVFCANHFSYFDVACMGIIIKNYYAFIGKSSAKGIPLLGYVFAKLHIQVDRGDKESRAKSLTRSIRALQNGRSIMVFPEGGIKTNNPPQMVLPLKDGAFAMAIRQQVPLVPITLLNNYQLLPDIKPYRIKRMPIRAIVHQPISTIGMTSKDVESLKEQAYQVIQKALNSE